MNIDYEKGGGLVPVIVQHFTTGEVLMLGYGNAESMQRCKDPGGCLVTAALGIVGALLGGFIGKRFFGMTVVAGFNLPALGLAIFGALLILLAYRLFIQRRHDRGP